MLKLGKRKQKVLARSQRKIKKNNNSISVFARILILFLKLGIIFSLIIAFSMFVRDFVKTNQFFNIKQIVVVGNRMVPEAEIRENLLLKQGMNIHALPAYKVEKDILEKFLEIKDIKIRRYYPSKLKIIIKERIAIARIAIARIKFIDKSILIDSSGVMFKDRMLDKQFIEIDNRICEDKQKLENIIVFLEDVKMQGFNQIFNNILYVSIDDKNNIYFKMKDNKTIFFGRNSLDITKLKFKYMLRVIEDLNTKQIEFESINLNYFNNVVDTIIVKRK